MNKTMNSRQLDAELIMISEARHHDPFTVLGRHKKGGLTVVRAFMPHATEISIAEGNFPLKRKRPADPH